MIAGCHTAEALTFREAPFADYTINWNYSNTEKEDLKARRRRFQEFTATLRRDAVKPCAIRPAGKKWAGKPGARAREQRDRKKP